MPVYVYRNLTTGETFEVEQRMIEPALVTDPITGDPVKRLIQPVGIAFKGSGFYVTDSRSSTKRTGSSSETKGAAEGGATESKSTEATPSSDSSSKDAPTKEAKPTPKPAAPPSKSASSGGAAD